MCLWHFISLLGSLPCFLLPSSWKLQASTLISCCETADGQLQRLDQAAAWKAKAAMVQGRLCICAIEELFTCSKKNCLRFSIFGMWNYGVWFLNNVRTKLNNKKWCFKGPSLGTRKITACSWNIHMIGKVTKNTPRWKILISLLKNILLLLSCCSEIVQWVLQDCMVIKKQTNTFKFLITITDS